MGGVGWTLVNLTVAALASASLAACDGRRSGAGDFAYEVSICQEQVIFDAQGMDEMVFYEESVWHSGSKEDLRVGGMLSVPDDRLGEPVYFDYDCLVRDERLFQVNF